MCRDTQFGALCLKQRRFFLYFCYFCSWESKWSVKEMETPREGWIASNEQMNGRMKKKLPNLGKHIDKPLDQLWPTLTYFHQSSRTNLEKPGSTWINLTQLAPNRTNSDQPGETWEIWKGFKKPEKLDAISGNLEKFGKTLILLTLFEQTCSNLEHPCSGSNWTKPQKP